MTLNWKDLLNYVYIFILRLHPISNQQCFNSLCNVPNYVYLVAPETNVIVSLKHVLVPLFLICAASISQHAI